MTNHPFPSISVAGRLWLCLVALAVQPVCSEESIPVTQAMDDWSLVSNGGRSRLCSVFTKAPQGDAIIKPVARAVFPLLPKSVVAAVAFASASDLPSTSSGQPLSKDDPSLMYVVDAAGIEDANEIFTLTALQGIVNRDAPRLFVRAYFHKFGPEDQVFMDYLVREKGYRFKWTTLGEAIDIFKSQGLLKGIIRYDGSHYEQGCIASTLAGLEDLLPLSESVATRHSTLLSGRDWRVEDRFDRRNPFWEAFRSDLTHPASRIRLLCHLRTARTGDWLRPAHRPVAGASRNALSGGDSAARTLGVATYFH